MGDSLEDEGGFSSLNYNVSQSNIIWKQELERRQSEVDALQEKLMEVKASIQCSEEYEKKELDVLWRRVNSSATFLTYLKSKAKMMAVLHIAHTSCGIRHQEVSDWSKDIDLSPFESTDDKTWIEISNNIGSSDEHDEDYISEILKSVLLVTNVMEALVKKVIMAEAEAVVEKAKVSLGQEEIKKKSLQIETMSAKVEEMEKFALGTNTILNEMRQKVEDMVQETSRQRQRAAENELELCRVKHDFESLKTYVSSLISVRETLSSSEKQFQTMERLFERLVAKTTHLEGEKTQKEAEVQKLMAKNVRLSALLDKKEAQLLAMNEQCKLMALNSDSI